MSGGDSAAGIYIGPEQVYPQAGGELDNDLYREEFINSKGNHQT